MQWRGGGSPVRLIRVARLLMQRVPPPVLPVLAALALSLMLPLPGWAKTTRDCGSRKATFDYNETQDGTPYASLSSEEQVEFEDRFCAEVARLEKFFTAPGGESKNHAWWRPAPHQPVRFLGLPDPYVALTGKFDGPYPDLQVSVSNAYTVSEGLLPAAFGHRGRLQFPAYEVPLQQSAIDHELTHVFFPNGNRLLAEGLAVYVQSLINDQAFPNYGYSLVQLVDNFICSKLGGFPSGLSGSQGMSLVAQLDKISTPNPLYFHIRLQPDSAPGDTYPIAGSFVKYVIEKYGWDRFHQLYVLTPLVPFNGDEGDSDRWNSIDKGGLTQLAKDWQGQFSAPQCSP